LVDFLKGQNVPTILVGDFNVEPSGDSYKLVAGYFHDVWLDNKVKERGLSYPADRPAKRIDYIFYKTNSGVRSRKAWTINTQASDHVPVVADLEIE